MFTSVGPKAKLYIPNQTQFNIDFKDKVNINIRGQIPVQIKKGLRDVLGFTSKRRHFEIPIMPR